MRSSRARPTRASLAAVVLTAAVLGAGAGCSTGNGGGARLRSGSLESLLEPAALDQRTFCTLVPPGEEEEGGLDGAVERAGVSYRYDGTRPDPLNSSLHVVLDRFASSDEVDGGVAAARRGAEQGVGPHARSGGALRGWPGSTVFSSSVVDYTGRPRTSFAAVVPVGTTVVRLQSFGVPEVGTRNRFDQLADRYLAGLTGSDTELRTIPPCRVG
jgi:hypothetical protein